MQQGQYQIFNNVVEGDNQLVVVQSLRYRPNRRILGFILNLFTLFIFYLFCQWFPRFRLWFYFENQEICFCSHVYIKDSQGNERILQLQRFHRTNTILDTIQFNYMLLAYYYSNENKSIIPLYSPLIDLPTKDIKNLTSLKESDIEALKDLYGPCNVEVPDPSIINFLAQELVSPFYFVQYVSVILCSFEGYIQLGMIMVGFSIVTTLINYAILRSATLTLKAKAHHEQVIQVKRINLEQKELIQKSSSLELVPGDQIIIQLNMFLPCDCILIEGEVLVNECTLTGESIPVHKESIANSKDLEFTLGEQKQHTLYAGTHVVFAKQQQTEIIAVITRTGFSSYKGQVFRNALFPKPNRLTFFNNAVKFIVVVAIVILGLYFGLIYKMVNLDLGVTLIFFRLGDAITWIVPPSLILFVNLCMTATLTRLHIKEIYGTQPQKNMQSGTIQTICFDKTGTLTSDKIMIKSIICSNFESLDDKQDRQMTFLKLQEGEEITKDQKEAGLLFDLMATCHQAYTLDGELLGDPLDLALIRFSNRNIEQSNDMTVNFRSQSTASEKEIDVIKVNGFESSLQRMSVVVRNKDGLMCFAKGSPETIARICTQQPLDLAEQTQYFSQQGYRVIAVAYKKLDAFVLSREECESNLIFMGLILLENSLKEDTAQVIQRLSAAKYKIKIISGDNPLTTINCGYKCGLLKNQSIYYIDVDGEHLVVKDYLSIEPQDLSTTLRIQRTDTDFSVVQQDIMNNSSGLWKNENLSYAFLVNGGYDLCITGSAMEKIVDKEMLMDVVVRAKIFARMKPDQKTQIIQILQLANQNVAMVGDGANDCAAIKQADIGVSFSCTDASTTAGFSSKHQSIQCVEQVLIEGKATMANVLEAFKYFMVINITKFITVELLMYQRQNFNGEQFLYINYLSNIPLIAVIGFTGPIQDITHHIIDSSMVHFINYFPTFLVILSSSLGLIFSYVHLIVQSWFHEEPQDITDYDHGYKLQGQTNTVMFLSLNLQFLFSFVALYTAGPFKPKIYRVPHVFIPIVTFFILVTYLYFAEAGQGLQNYLQLVVLPHDFQFQQYVINVSAGLFAILGGQLTWYLKYSKVQ